jgi:hypothetical protein
MRGETIVGVMRGTSSVPRCWRAHRGERVDDRNNEGPPGELIPSYATSNSPTPPPHSSSLTPVRLARSGGFGASELLRLERLVNERQSLLLGAWDEYFTATE